MQHTTVRTENNGQSVSNGDLALDVKTHSKFRRVFGEDYRISAFTSSVLPFGRCLSNSNRTEKDKKGRDEAHGEFSGRRDGRKA